MSRQLHEASKRTPMPAPRTRPRLRPSCPVPVEAILNAKSMYDMEHLSKPLNVEQEELRNCTNVEEMREILLKHVKKSYRVDRAEAPVGYYDV